MFTFYKLCTKSEIVLHTRTKIVYNKLNCILRLANSFDYFIISISAIFHNIIKFYNQVSNFINQKYILFMIFI